MDWLTLNDYSHKYKISLSTLRRKIKIKSIEYKTEEGKYWIKDRGATQDRQEFSSSKESSGEVLSSVNQLMQEVKNAYISVLQEKEKQIMELKEEVADLKTLVQILESDNKRLKSNLSESAPIDNWLEQNFES